MQVVDPCSVMKSDIAPPVHQYVHFHIERFFFFYHYVNSASKFNTYLWHIVVCLPKGIFSLYFTAGRPVLILPDLSRSPTGGSSREDHIWSPTSKRRCSPGHRWDQHRPRCAPSTGPVGRRCIFKRNTDLTWQPCSSPHLLDLLLLFLLLPLTVMM